MSPEQKSSGACDLLRQISIEILPEQAEGFRPSAEMLPRQTQLFLTHVLGRPLSAQVAAAETLIARDYEPVPHLAARNFKSEEEFTTHVRRLKSAGVKSLLLLGGNPSAKPLCFESALQLLRHPVIGEAGLERLYFAGYPERHPTIPAEILKSALIEKIGFARRIGVSPGVVTQFGFDGSVMADWALQLRRDGIDVPIRFGVAGVTSLPKLIKFAAICGVGASLSALTRQTGSILKAVRDQNPGDVIAALEAGLRQYEITDVSLHFYPFGGWERTLAWVVAQRTEHAGELPTKQIEEQGGEK